VRRDECDIELWCLYLKAIGVRLDMSLSPLGGRAAGYLRLGVAMAISQCGRASIKHHKTTIL
jgi:hypothetical protein